MLRGTTCRQKMELGPSVLQSESTLEAIVELTHQAGVKCEAHLMPYCSLAVVNQVSTIERFPPLVTLPMLRV